MPPRKSSKYSTFAQTTKSLRSALALICLVALLCCLATAQDRADTYPSGSIRIVVPFPPGGPADIIARIIGQKMTEDWGQAVIIENRAGANTIIGAQAVAKAAPVPRRRGSPQVP